MMRTFRLAPAVAMIGAVLASEGCQRNTPASTQTTSTQTSAPTPAPDTAAPPASAPQAPSPSTPSGSAPAAYPNAAPAYGGGNAYSPNGAGMPGRFGGGGGAPALSLQEFQARFRQRIMRADTNHDGRVSLQEWIAWRAAHPHPNGGGPDPTRQFQHFDINHDGFITPDEIDVISARRYAHRMQMSAGAGRPAPGGGEADDAGMQ